MSRNAIFLCPLTVNRTAELRHYRWFNSRLVRQEQRHFCREGSKTRPISRFGMTSGGVGIATRCYTEIDTISLPGTISPEFEPPELFVFCHR